jgi:hypothetical protein
MILIDGIIVCISTIFQPHFMVMTMLLPSAVKSVSLERDFEIKSIQSLKEMRLRPSQSAEARWRAQSRHLTRISRPSLSSADNWKWIASETFV